MEKETINQQIASNWWNKLSSIEKVNQIQKNKINFNNYDSDYRYICYNNEHKDELYRALYVLAII